MGASQRNKGAQFEREVMAEFSAALGRVYKRHIGQARDGGHDGIAGPFIIECKRRKTLTTIEKWYEQVRAAWRGLGSPLKPGDPRVPVVVCRADKGKAMAILSLDDFLDVARRAYPPEAETPTLSNCGTGAVP